MISWLRDFTDLPLGVYPNLGYLSAGGWRSEAATGGASTRSWRSAGAPRARRSSAAAAASARAHRRRPQALGRHQAGPDARTGSGGRRGRARRTVAPPNRGRTRAAGSLYPARLSRSDQVEPGVFVPTQGSFLIWKYLFREGIGAHQRCLDIGCGSGLQTVQLRATAPPTSMRSTSTGRRHEHAHERVPQRRRRPRQRRCRRPLPVGSRGALRRDRREPLPDAGRPVRAGLDPPPARLLGARSARPPDRPAARGARRRRRRLRDAAFDHRPAAHDRSARAARASGSRSSTSASSSSTSFSTSVRPDRAGRGALGRLSPRLGATTLWSPTYSRSPEGQGR